MTALRIIEGGGDTCDRRGTHVVGQVVRSWRQKCRYGNHLETCVEMRGVNTRWTEHVEHDCPARPQTTLSPYFDEVDEHEEGGIGA